MSQYTLHMYGCMFASAFVELRVLRLLQRLAVSFAILFSSPFFFLLFGPLKGVNFTSPLAELRGPVSRFGSSQVSDGQVPSLAEE